jgi:hypothetical protein
MICQRPDHECRCKRTEKNCEYYQKEKEIAEAISSSPSLAEIIETAFEEDPVTVYPKSKKRTSVDK